MGNKYCSFYSLKDIAILKCFFNKNNFETPKGRNIKVCTKLVQLIFLIFRKFQVLILLSFEDIAPQMDTIFFEYFAKSHIFKPLQKRFCLSLDYEITSKVSTHCDVATVKI